MERRSKKIDGFVARHLDSMVRQVLPDLVGVEPFERVSTSGALTANETSQARIVFEVDGSDNEENLHILCSPDLLEDLLNGVEAVRHSPAEEADRVELINY